MMMMMVIIIIIIIIVVVTIIRSVVLHEVGFIVSLYFIQVMLNVTKYMTMTIFTIIIMKD